MKNACETHQQHLAKPKFSYSVILERPGSSGEKGSIAEKSLSRNSDYILNGPVMWSKFLCVGVCVCYSVTLLCSTL